MIETGSANLSRFMGSVLTGYTMYFNRRHERVGHLMQGRFGSQVVKGNEYLLKLSRYIHLNPDQTKAWRGRPVKERINQLRAYRWSSFRSYAGLEPEAKWITYGPIRTMMPGWGPAPQRYGRYVEEALRRPDEEFCGLMRVSRLAVGSKEFQEEISRAHESQAQHRARREDVSLRHTRVWEDVDSVMKDIGKKLRLPGEEFRRKRRDGITRAIAAMALVRRCGLTQRQAATRLGLQSGSAVSYLIRMAKERARSDGSVRQMIERTVQA
jgi:hypothetical protein